MHSRFQVSADKMDVASAAALGAFEVSGSVQAKLRYHSGVLTVHIIGCSDLARVRPETLPDP